MASLSLTVLRQVEMRETNEIGEIAVVDSTVRCSI